MKTKYLISTLALMLMFGTVQADAQGILGRMRDAVKDALPKREQSAEALKKAQPVEVPPAAMTPQAVIDNTPSLPTPQQWAAGDIHEFTEKLAELEQLAGQAMMNAMVPQQMPTQKDMEELYATQQRQFAESDRQLQEMFGMSIDEMMGMSEEELEAKITAGVDRAHSGAMAEAEKQMAVLASLGITEADMKKIEKMNDKESEEYIKRRLRENGITEAEFRRRMDEAGIEMLSDGELAEEEARQQKAQTEAEAMSRVQETFNEYMMRSRSVDSLLQDDAVACERLLSALNDKYKASAEAIRDQMNELTDRSMYSTVTMDDHNVLIRRYNGVIMEWRTEVYKVWSDYIRRGQEHYRELLPYAAAADDAKSQMPDITGNASIDQQQRISYNAIEVAMHYLNLTGSEPGVEYGIMHEIQADGDNDKG